MYVCDGIFFFKNICITYNSFIKLYYRFASKVSEKMALLHNLDITFFGNTWKSETPILLFQLSMPKKKGMRPQSAGVLRSSKLGLNNPIRAIDQDEPSSIAAHRILAVSGF